MTFQTPDANYDQKVRDSFHAQQFMHFIGAVLEGLEPGQCRIRLPFKPELSQHDGFFHAGIITTLADNAAGFAAYTLMPADASVLTVEFKMNFLSPGDGDYLLARGSVIKAGRTLTVCRSQVWTNRDGEDRLCATALLTMMALKGKPRNGLCSSDSDYPCPLPP